MIDKKQYNELSLSNDLNSRKQNRNITKLKELIIRLDKLLDNKLLKPNFFYINMYK